MPKDDKRILKNAATCERISISAFARSAILKRAFKVLGIDPRTYEEEVQEEPEAENE